MQSTSSLIDTLKKDYPQFAFVTADEFWWSADKQTVYINPDITYASEFSLHELSHALLDHKGYRSDIDLIKLERDAWIYARMTLGPLYDFVIGEEIAEDNLDTYREWLYSRSVCPDCNTTGIQAGVDKYRCLACGHTWRVNEARLCALRRYSLQTK